MANEPQDGKKGTKQIKAAVEQSFPQLHGKT